MNSPPYALIASFLAFTESKTLQEAADTLKISQPALTSHLQAFEGYFPQAVFDYEGRRKILTNFGHEVKELLKRRFDHLDDDLKLLNEKVQDPKNVRIRIAGRSEILNVLADRVNFQGTLQFDPIATEEAAEGLIERKYDLAISYDLSKAQELHAKKFFLYDYALAIPARWKMNSNKVSQSTIEKLADMPYLSHRPHSENLETLLKKYGIKQSPYYKKIIPDWIKLAQLVQSGEGWTIIPTYFVRELSGIDYITVPSSLIPDVQFYLLYRKESASRFWFKSILSQLMTKDRV